MHVYKAGLFSGLAHDHEIEAPIEWGEVNDSESPAVEVRVSSSKLRVWTPKRLNRRPRYNLSLRVTSPKLGGCGLQIQVANEQTQWSVPLGSTAVD